MERQAKFAGSFYPKTFEDIDKSIRKSFLDGPGEFPIKKRGRNVLGIITPHAGYQFSGACAAWAYKELAESEFPDVYVILGVNHSGVGSDFSTCLFSDWSMPFGTVDVNVSFGKSLMQKFPKLKNEFEPEVNEHSIEVQLPFLQYINKDRLKDITFVPILIKSGDYNDLCALGDAIADTELNVCVIASSDFTHFGKDYGFYPFAFNKKENLYTLDGGALDFIKKMDSKSFFEYAKKTTICGSGAIVVAIEACRNFGIKKGNLLHYYTSGDVTGSYDNAVGYAAVGFERI